MAATDAETVRREFSDAVNMTASELERWLERDDLTEKDLERMRKVHGYVARHGKQRPSGDVSETPWRYSLMNWGHDPLKK